MTKRTPATALPRAATRRAARCALRVRDGTTTTTGRAEQPGIGRLRREQRAELRQQATLGGPGARLDHQAPSGPCCQLFTAHPPTPCRMRPRAALRCQSAESPALIRPLRAQRRGRRSRPHSRSGPGVLPELARAVRHPDIATDHPIGRDPVLTPGTSSSMDVVQHRHQPVERRGEPGVSRVGRVELLPQQAQLVALVRGEGARRCGPPRCRSRSAFDSAPASS